MIAEYTYNRQRSDHRRTFMGSSNQLLTLVLAIVQLVILTVLALHGQKP